MEAKRGENRGLSDSLGKQTNSKRYGQNHRL